MNTKEPVIHVKNFSKSYGTLEAVKNISFDVYANEIFGFVGPNGAGKSTTINTLCTIQPKSRGEITICGHDVETERDLVRNDIGVVFQDMTLDGKLTVEETLKLHCDFYSVPIREAKERIDFGLELVDLTTEELIQQGVAFRFGALTVTPAISWILILIVGTLFFFLCVGRFKKVDLSEIQGRFSGRGMRR